MDKLGSKMGRIHMQKQDLSKLQLRKVKALKRKHDGGDEDEKDDGEMLRNEDFKKIKSRVTNEKKD